MFEDLLTIKNLSSHKGKISVPSKKGSSSKVKKGSSVELSDSISASKSAKGFSVVVVLDFPTISSASYDRMHHHKTNFNRFLTIYYACHYSQRSCYKGAVPVVSIQQEK